jgi:hypothetical protein
MSDPLHKEPCLRCGALEVVPWSDKDPDTRYCRACGDLFLASLAETRRKIEERLDDRLSNSPTAAPAALDWKDEHYHDPKPA